MQQKLLAAIPVAHAETSNVSCLQKHKNTGHTHTLRQKSRKSMCVCATAAATAAATWEFRKTFFLMKTTFKYAQDCKYFGILAFFFVDGMHYTAALLHNSFADSPHSLACSLAHARPIRGNRISRPSKVL